MEIISHRGYWTDHSQKNTSSAMIKSYNLGLGVETDVRDYAGDLYISHDPINLVENLYTLSDFFNKYIEIINNKVPLALNIKADGISEKLNALIKSYSVKNYFVFDMSVPETLKYCKLGIPFYSRQSEYEPNPVFYSECEGVWLDAFEQIWYDESALNSHVNNGKKIAIVSQELHGREPYYHWDIIKGFSDAVKSHLILCTDYPVQALEYFN